MRVQHGSTGGLPRVKSRRPLSTLAQTPSLRVSLGHFPMPELGLGVGLGVGFGLGEGQPPPQGVQLPHAEIVVKKMRLRAKKRVMELEAIFFRRHCSLAMLWVNGVWRKRKGLR